MNALRRTAAIAAASGLLLGLTGCSSTDDKPKDPISAPNSVKIIEPKVGSGHRFDDLIKATFEGMDKVDIANFQGTRTELAYAMFGRANHFTVVGIGFDDDAAEFCFRDIVHRSREPRGLPSSGGRGSGVTTTRRSGDGGVAAR